MEGNIGRWQDLREVITDGMAAISHCEESQCIGTMHPTTWQSRFCIAENVEIPAVTPIRLSFPRNDEFNLAVIMRRISHRA